MPLRCCWVEADPSLRFCLAVDQALAVTILVDDGCHRTEHAVAVVCFCFDRPSYMQIEATVDLEYAPTSLVGGCRDMICHQESGTYRDMHKGFFFGLLL